MVIIGDLYLDDIPFLGLDERPRKGFFREKHGAVFLSDVHAIRRKGIVDDRLEDPSIRDFLSLCSWNEQEQRYEERSSSIMSYLTL